MSQYPLLEPDRDASLINLPDGQLRYFPHLFPESEADRLMASLQAEIPWEQSDIWIAGQRRKIPRLNAWYGDAGADYSYSGRLFRALSWLPDLKTIKQQVESACGTVFNSALVNLYRDGSDSVDWHSDDEPELGSNPIIASVSLGAVRRFQIKHKSRREVGLRDLDLGHGSLLVMEGEFQHHWRHRLPKMPGVNKARLNITFRRVHVATLLPQ